ncbi:hypothetical protein ND748_16455, partial [Frankia sp. AiPs1]|nr:hypothetical protein [Frankia sp. AiPs1]
MRAVAGGGGVRDWSVEVGADATVRELGFRLFGPPGELGLVVEGEPFGPEVPVAICGIVDGVEVAPAEPVAGYRSEYSSGFAAAGASTWQGDDADAWWEPTVAPQPGGFEAAASDSDTDWWTPAPSLRAEPSDPLPWLPAGSHPAGWELVVVAGPGAGWRLPVPGGQEVSLLVDAFDGPLLERGGVEEAAAEFTVADDAVTCRWAAAEFTVADDAVTCRWAAAEFTVEGEAPADDQVLRPGAVLTVGRSTARLARADGGLTRPGQALGVPAEHRPTVPFHRTARPVPPAAPDVVTLPPTPREPGRASPFNWASLGAPLVLAGLLFTMTRQLTYALLSAMGAIIVVFSFVESRLRRRREVRRGAAERAAELAAFDTRLAEARRQELRRRWDGTPTAADWVRAADQLGATLWERGPTDSDFLDVFVAVGHLPWRPAVERVDQAGAEIRERVARSGGLSPVPLTFSLDRGELVTLRGPRPEVLGLVRAAICQACCAQGPAHLRIGLLVEDTADWEWLKWLPHLRDEASAELRVRHIDATADPQRAVDEAAAWLTAADGDTLNAMAP